MRRRLPRALPAALAGLVLIAGCTNAPPPPLVTSNVASTKPAPSRQLTQAVVGLDSVRGGYNPHVLGDQSTVTTALATLLLPTVFRHGPDGALRLDGTVMESAKVTDAKPFTVTYQVRGDASWSDGVPITAQDFLYLRRQMATQPGVVNPTGYRLISDISTVGNGKTVTVTFAKPYPAWRTLFSNLLPAHLLKDAPGGWQAALATSFPAVAGPFVATSIDPARGEIVLRRNARYWGTPARLDQIVLRAAPPGAVVRGLDTGHDQLASFTAGETAVGKLRDLGDEVSERTVPRPRVVRLLLRPGSAALADDTVRDAVAEALDRDALIAAGKEHARGSLRADALAAAPSDPDYEPTLPSDAPIAQDDPDATAALLSEAGYIHGDSGWTRDGHRLRLTIAVPDGAKALQRIAKLVKRQLAEHDIDAKVTTPKSPTLFGKLLAGGKQRHGPAIALVSAPVLDSGAAALAAEFGCPTQSLGGKPSAPSPPNPSGFCDSGVEYALTQAATGQESLPDVVAELEPTLWRESAVIPLFQPAELVAVRKDMAGVREGPPLRSPFPSAPRWRRSS